MEIEISDSSQGSFHEGCVSACQLHYTVRYVGASQNSVVSTV